MTRFQLARCAEADAACPHQPVARALGINMCVVWNSTEWRIQLR
jgi:hypothetical protein